MRILYNSKQSKYKLPFGTLTEGQSCRISVYIPASCLTQCAKLIFFDDAGANESFELKIARREGDYEIYTCVFSLSQSSLYFYYFRIVTKNEEFSLYKEGRNMTNIGSGECWQLSVIPKSFSVPKGYAGEVMYQIFPDRFYRSEGSACDISGKLEPFYIHERTDEIPDYLPNERGEIENCDFFGGDLRGIAEKIEYLSELGVKVIYLNPIFKAWSNHRYDTADYLKIDELLGNEEDLSYLCEKAHERGMKVILDGVFSHTGSNSIYFDKCGIFGNGAYLNPDSPYRTWYDVNYETGEYTSWWGISTLPCLNENDASFRDFLIESEDSVVAHWVRLGVDGFRLDVADELPDEFIASFRKRMKQIKEDSILIGEVWEDASNKISYGKRRRYFTGGELDSVMNYPFRNAIIDFILGHDGGESLCDTVMTIAENYPAGVLGCLMNMLSTHDTVRILSALSPEKAPGERCERAIYRMSAHTREHALERLCAASFLQFVLPGMPCIFYGDEIGTEGFEDPFCRSYFRWEDVHGNKLRDFFISLSNMRGSLDALKSGDVLAECVSEGFIVIRRRIDGTVCCAYVNVGAEKRISVCGKSVFFGNAKLECGEFVLDRYGFILFVDTEETEDSYE